jgi:hypothetical protein
MVPSTTGTNQMVYEQTYAWAGMNFLLYAIGAAVLIGMAVAIGYSVQDWLEAASKRRAEFIKSIQETPTKSRR